MLKTPAPTAGNRVKQAGLWYNWAYKIKNNRLTS